MNIFLILASSLIIGQSGILSKIPSEPPFSSPTFIDWEIFSGHAPFIQSIFDLDQDKEADYYTLRKIISTQGIRGSREEVLEQISEIQKENPDWLVFFAQSGIEEDLYIAYITYKYPLFYCLKNTTWIDKEEDGLNGNEEVYEGLPVKGKKYI